MRTSLSVVALSLWGWILLSGFSCGPTLKNCKLQSDCPSDHRCRSYSCQLLDSCNSNSDCNAPRTCVRNRCMEPKELCKVNKDCPTGTVCDGGVCGVARRPSCKADRDCLSSESCSQSKCIKGGVLIPCAGPGDCSGPYVCIQNRCKKSPTGCQSNSECKAPLVCSKGQCVKSSTPCNSDSNCKTGEQCKNGVCTLKSTGTCRLSNSPSTLGFYRLKAGESKTLVLKLSNRGTGTCQISQMNLRDYQSAVGEYSLGRSWPAQTLAAGKTLEVKITFKAKAPGSLRAALDVFSGSNVLRSVSLYSSVTQDTAIPKSGWATVLYEQSTDSSYFSGCFWGNQTFEVASNSVFTEGGLNISYGNMRTTKDGGDTWKCDNCVSGRGWPRTAYHEIVDMRLSGFSCLKDRAYVFGSFEDTDPNNTKPTLFTRTSRTSWTPIRDKKHPLYRSVGSSNRVFTWDNRWFLMMQSIVLNFVPEADGQVKKQNLVSLFPPTNGVIPFYRDFHVAHQVGLIVGFKRSFIGGRSSAAPYIFYNTTNAVLPAGFKTNQMPQYWKDVTPPCRNCTLYRGRVIGAQSFLVMGVLLNASRKTTGFALWHSGNRGQSWTKVYENKTTEILSMGDILALSSQRIIAVAGPSYNSGRSSSTGLLLESTDGGRSFKPIPLSQLKGKAIRGGKLPGLYNLKLSPDKKTLFVLGSGIILRWKP